MNHVEAFTDFLRYRKGLAENTVGSYAWDLRQYLEWLDDRGVKPEEIKIKDVDDFFIWLRKGERNSISSVNRKIYSLRHFYRWMLRQDLIEKSPLDFFEHMKEPKRLPTYLNPTDQAALIRASSRWTNIEWINKRNHLLILFLIDTGLRISEACSLEINKLDLEQGLLRIKGKAGRDREVVLSGRVIREIREYLELLQAELKRGEMKFGSSSQFKRYLFVNRLGRPLLTRHAFRIVKEIGLEVGIEGLHPHTLRHTFASNLRRKKVDLLIIKESLGHSSIATTQIYTHLADEERRLKLRRLLK